MRIDKIIPQRKCFDLLSNSLNLCTWKCTETSLKNLYVDIGANLKGHSQLLDRADLDTTFARFEKRLPQPEIKSTRRIRVEIRFNPA